MNRTHSTLLGVLLMGILGILVVFHSTRTSDDSMSPQQKLKVSVNVPLRSASIVATDSSAETDSRSDRATSLSSLSESGEMQNLPQSEQQSLARAFSKARHEIWPLSEYQKNKRKNDSVHFVASNPRNQVRALFVDEGARLMSGYLGRDWEGLISLEDSYPLEIRQQGARVEYAHENIVEWYHNKSEGIEHGFIIANRPAGVSDKGITCRVSVKGLTVEPLADREEGSSDLQFVNEEGEPVLSYTDLKVWDANGKELPASMEPTSNGLQILVADAEAVYPITIDPLIASQEAKLIPSLDDRASGDEFGYSVSVSGDLAVIGAPQDDFDEVDSGCAYLFERSGTTWSIQERFIESGIEEGIEFGYSVSISGTHIAIGAPGQFDTGQAYMYYKQGSVWRKRTLNASSLAVGDDFGTSVSVDGDTTLVGAPRADGPGSLVAGAVYAFERTPANNWIERDRFTSSNTSTTNFGWTVGVDGDTAVIGTRSGSAEVFVRSGTTWSLEQVITTNGAGVNERFGWGVAIDGDTALIGAHFDDDNGTDSGTAFVFVRSGTTWTRQRKLRASDGAADDRFGYSVSIDGDTALIGAYLDDDDGTDSGSAYVFVRSGTTWTEQQKLTANDGEQLDRFGFSVSVDGDTALVGAYLQEDFTPANAGSAYVFVRSGTTWSLQQKLTAQEPTDDEFGTAVSLSGDTALIGEPLDDGDGLDMGAVYIFVRSGSTWSLQQKIIADDASSGDFFGSAVCVDGDTALIGANGDANGSVYLFSRGGSFWSLDQKISASDLTPSPELFGFSVSLDSNFALVGAPGDDVDGSNSGSAYVFQKVGPNWIERAKLTASDRTASDEFGFSVDISGNTALIGAYRDDDNGSNSGSAYVFVRSGSAWTQQQKLIASDGVASDEFGQSVSLDGDTAVVGTDFAQSAYVFVRSGATWSEEQILIPEDGPSGRFGSAVSLDGDIVLIGAYGDNDNGFSSGSAYVFVRVGMIWRQQLKILPNDGLAQARFGYSVSLDGDTALVGASELDGRFSDEGAAYVFRGPSSDWDEISDAFESANGFDPNVPYDHVTKNTDGDPVIDLLELFEGSDPNDPQSYYGLQQTSVNSVTQALTTRFRRDTTRSDITASPRWSINLIDWYETGVSVDGVRVDFSQEVVETGAGYEIIELTADVALGQTTRLFLILELEPNQ